jgi:hypothetical protein
MDLNGLSADLEQFVQQEIAEGKYQSAEEVVSAAFDDVIAAVGEVRGRDILLTKIA